MSVKILFTRWFVRFSAYRVNYEIRHDHPQFEKIKELLREGKVRQAVILYNNPEGKKRVAKKTARAGKKIEVVGNRIRVGGEDTPRGLSELYAKNVGKTGGKAIRAFIARFQENPNRSSGEALARFLEHNGVTITSRGTMLLYKRVRTNYRDQHSGRFDNSPGTLVSIPRKQVNPDHRVECSYGLHVCGYQYLRNFYHGDPTIVVEVDPRDVVSVPHDYNSSKIRVCRYKVWFDVRDFNSDFVHSDVLGRLQYFDVSQLPEITARATRKPNSDLTKNWTK